MKSRRVCIETRTPPASLPLKGQVTRHTIVKWPITREISIRIFQEEQTIIIFCCIFVVAVVLVVVLCYSLI